MNTTWVAGDACTVSVCVAEVRRPSAAVSVGVPVVLSSYVKLVVLPLPGIVTLVTCVLPLENLPVREVVVRATVCAVPAVVTLLKVSSNVTIIAWSTCPRGSSGPPW